jgi:hypothetical protein
MKKLINLEETHDKQDSPKRFIDYITQGTDYLKTIHDILNAGYHINKVQIIRRLGCLNLGDNIHKLRKRYGYDYIVTRMEINKSTGKRYAVYYKNEKYLK